MGRPSNGSGPLRWGGWTLLCGGCSGRAVRSGSGLSGSGNSPGWRLVWPWHLLEPSIRPWEPRWLLAELALVGFNAGFTNTMAKA